MTAATVVTTARGWIRSMSPEIETTLGLLADESQDRTWFDLVHPADTALARRAWAVMVDTHSTEVIQVRLWSNERWAITSLRLRPSDAGLFAIEVAAGGESTSTFVREGVRHARAPVSTFASASRRTRKVGGDWNLVMGLDVSGPAALEVLWNSSDQAVAVLDPMDRACEHGTQLGPAISARDQPPRRGTAVPALTQDSSPAEARAPDGAVTVEAQTARTSRARLRPVDNWICARGLDRHKLALAAGVVLVAFLLRTIDLTSLPTGFHGDEAIFGMESQRVLDHGSIGVYTGSALGQPTAPFYPGAFTIWLFGPTVFATRILAALAGTVTVAAVYLIVQKRFDHRIAVASAFVLAVMTWNIHFSRIAFGLAWWPLSVIVAIAAVDRATTTGQRKHWFIAGALSAFGVYVYNSHWSFGLALVGFMLVWLVWPNERRANRDAVALAMGVLGGEIVLFPMVRYVLDDKNAYFNHFTTVSRRTLPEWTEASSFGKIESAVRWYFEAWNNLLFNPFAEGVDASGLIRPVPLIFTLLAAVGVAQIVRRHRTTFSGLVLVTLVALPLGPAMTVDGIVRREFAMSPLLAILAGIGAVAVVDFAKNRVHIRVGAIVSVVIVAVMLQTSVRPYFTTFRNDAVQQWVFAEELTKSVDAIQVAERDGPVFVNWYSLRHSYNYETLRFLLDGTPGIDRAPVDQGFVENPDLTLFSGTPSNQLYVMIGDYTRSIEALRQLYPQGRVVIDEVDPAVVAYLVPTG